MKHEDITGKIIRAFFNVYNELGYGFLEKVYENALLIEIANMGLDVRRQYPIEVFYGEDVVGEYFADLVVEDKVIIELKAAEGIAPEHEAQLVNYIRATEFEVGLLLNFGPKAQFKRKIFDKEFK